MYTNTHKQRENILFRMNVELSQKQRKKTDKEIKKQEQKQISKQHTEKGKMLI